MAIPTASAAALNAVAPGSLGKASAIFNTLRQFGAVFGIAIGTAIFNSNGSLAGPAAVTSGYRPALAAAAGFSVLGALVALGRGLDQPQRNRAGQPGEQRRARLCGLILACRLDHGQPLRKTSDCRSPLSAEAVRPCCQLKSCSSTSTCSFTT